MLPRTASGRRFLAGACLLGAAAVLAVSVRRWSPPYVPEAPAYRQRGPADAPAVIAEFSDFQCPACKSGAAALKEIQAMFPGKVRLIFRHYPWHFHPWALEAAVAAECAGRQGRFWDYHDALFAGQAEWSARKPPGPNPFFERYAKELKLDLKGFEACRKDEAVAGAIREELREAQERWIGSTPTFFVNGLRLVGARQLRSRGLNRIEEALE